mgnify:CR=1 FL=1
MKMSAGAPASICFASALLAPYETITLLPVLASNCCACSSSASLRLAAAKTVTSAATAFEDANVNDRARTTERNDPGWPAHLPESSAETGRA